MGPDNRGLYQKDGNPFGFPPGHLSKYDYRHTQPGKGAAPEIQVVADSLYYFHVWVYYQYSILSYFMVVGIV